MCVKYLLFRPCFVVIRLHLHLCLDLSNMNNLYDNCIKTNHQYISTFT